MAGVTFRFIGDAGEIQNVITQKVGKEASDVKKAYPSFDGIVLTVTSMAFDFDSAAEATEAKKRMAPVPGVELVA